MLTIVVTDNLATGDLQITVCRPPVGPAADNCLLSATDRLTVHQQMVIKRPTVDRQLVRVAFREAFLYLNLPNIAFVHAIRAGSGSGYGFDSTHVVHWLRCEAFLFLESKRRVAVGLMISMAPGQAKVIKTFLSRCGEFVLVVFESDSAIINSYLEI